MRRLTLISVLVLSNITYAQVQTSLIARNTGKKTLEDGKVITTMGFAQKLSQNPDVPGPTLTYFEGDSVTIDLWNVSQGAPHTIHLHGLDVDQQNDGVPHLSFVVEHMKHGYYKFKAPHPGTYLYHCHVVSAIHVQAGMYGMLIVKPKDAPNLTWDNGYPYTSDYNIIFSEIDTLWHHDSVLEHSKDHMHVQIPEYNPSYFLVNGKSGSQLDSVFLYTTKDRTTYLRLANIGYYGNLIHFPEHTEVTIIDSDGRPLPTPINSHELYIFPGERYGVLMTPKLFIKDSIVIDYLDLNTMKVKGTERYLVKVDDYFATPIVSKQGEIKVYPNPLTHMLNIDLGKHTIQNMYVTDGVGRIVNSDIKVSSPQKLILNTTNWNPGVYLIRIECVNGYSYSQKLVK
jgi:FtsP/CotA-like multicopper oxidase with cupredoxin domain